jgi:hypothetical protein
MSKIFRTRCFIFDATGVRQANATIEVDITKQKVEFRASGYTVTTSIDKVKELISEYNVIGTTTMKEDKDNQTLIRYTKGILRTTSKGVTMSLSHVDETGNDVYMITADASEFDQYMRGKLYEKPRT